MQKFRFAPPRFRAIFLLEMAKSRIATFFKRSLLTLLLLALAGLIAFNVSPWPGALVIRTLFAHGAHNASTALAKHLPPPLTESLHQVYDPKSSWGQLDVFHPADAKSGQTRLPLIVWVHGGGFVSGHKEDVANYCRILAAKGFVVASINYTIAPEATYPQPVLEANAACSWLLQQSTRYPFDPKRVILAGDSAGSHIASQLALACVDPVYAQLLGFSPALNRSNLRGTLLHCGVYDASSLNLDGPFGQFLHTILWSYFGTRDYRHDPRLGEFSIPRHLTPDFPPTFLSAGNADPLLPQSQAMQQALIQKNVRTEALFFPATQSPALGHEYQFNLDSPAGQLALERSVQFLQSL